jgi:hypothetical protein
VGGIPIWTVDLGAVGGSAEVGHVGGGRSFRSGCFGSIQWRRANADVARVGWWSEKEGAKNDGKSRVWTLEGQIGPAGGVGMRTWARGERASGLGKSLEYRGLFFSAAPLEWSARLYRCV